MKTRRLNHMEKESSASKTSKPKQRRRQKNEFSVDSRVIELASKGLNISGLSSSLLELRNRAIPKGLHSQFLKAKSLREKDDLIRAIIDAQTEFGPLGFKFFIKKDKALERSRKRFTPIIKDFNLNGLNRQMWQSLCTYSNVIFHWKMRNNRELEYIQVLNPYDVEIVPFLNGQSLLYLRVPDVIEKLVQGKGNSQEEKLLLRSIPKKYVEAVKGGIKSSTLIGKDRKMVLLSNSDGEYWLIANTEGFSDRLVPPSMTSIYASVENRNMLVDGDFSVAYLIKNFIMHVKTGESITSGPKAGSRQNYAETKHLKALKKQFKMAGNAMELYTGHLVNIDYVFPDTKVFDPEKFTSPERRILRWGGVGEILLLGTGTNFAAGFINLKRLIAKIKCYREIIDSVWQAFFEHKTIRLDISKDHIPEIIYDDSLLKEYSVLVREMQSLIDRGALSKQTALLKAGFNPDVEETNKQEEMDKGTLYMPTLTSMMPLDQALEKQQKKEKGEPGRNRQEVTKSGGTSVGAPENPRPSTS